MYGDAFVVKISAQKTKPTLRYIDPKLGVRDMSGVPPPKSTSLSEANFSLFNLKIAEWLHFRILLEITVKKARFQPYLLQYSMKMPKYSENIQKNKNMSCQKNTFFEGLN